jgi:RNA polymerase sigma-70 factor, ECF subfamily
VRERSTQELLAGALAGDRTAMRQLFAHVLSPAIERRLAHRLALAGADRAALRDHVQEVLVHLLERDAEALRRWDPARGPIEPYVAKIADNLVISRLRKRPPPSPTDEIDCAASASASPEQGAAYSSLVARVLRDLGEQDAILFRAIYLEELSPDEAAAVLGISRDAVHKRIQRLRVKLTELLSSPAAVAT